MASKYSGDLKRFIPAGAGNTSRSGREVYCLTVYPRWRGEHYFVFSITLFISGLSPLARGTRLMCAACHANRRFIPAGAGNTLYRQCEIFRDAVYPRWRGEHLKPEYAFKVDRGLSPLARGTHEFTQGNRAASRFIPAGAGNTRVSSDASPELPVYPRWRGEHAFSGGSNGSMPGLSPLARGTRESDSLQRRLRRFIPAGAGNTDRRWLCL
ncbi:hypothetical protein SEES8400_06211 [Salmonella enterica subsp. enterica serovar Senftenberg str. ATCC 8400]|nr:hypothetical protein SEES8400_06211 [Salmonella enterica subsp. enterica serovar Senftenberg str. ATCC 8400]